MGLIKELAEVWREQIERRRKQEEKYRIEYAFTSGGTKYYRYADITNLPYDRGLTAIQVYNEVEMRCSVDLLKAFTQAIDDVLMAKEINIYAIKQLNDIIKQRLQFSVDVELLYKLASVCFFDKTENPRVYDQQYAEKKIAKWRKDKGVADFFSQKPLKELMPFLANVNHGLDIYTPINEQINKTHEELFRTISSLSKQKTTTSGEKYRSYNRLQFLEDILTGLLYNHIFPLLPLVIETIATRL